MSEAIGIGTTVYRFDQNRRVYKRREDGRAVGGPIWREHWYPMVITSETSRSWVTEYGYKIPKKDPDPYTWAFSQEDIDHRAWVVENRNRIAETVRRIEDLRTLRQIATLAGYKE